MIAGILPDRRLNLLHAIQSLTTEHFGQVLYRNLFTALSHYFDVAGGVLPGHVLKDLLHRENVDAAQAFTFAEAFRACVFLEVDDEEFRWSVQALKDDRAKQLTGEAIATAYEILERGVEVKGEELRGHEDARVYLTQQTAEIENLESAGDAPEGDMRHDRDEVLREYKEANKIKGLGILTGLRSLDLAIRGFQPGELGLIAAFTNSGKSNFCAQTAWHASVVQGKNVFFATSETVRSVVRRRIIARHSALPQFGLARPLNARDIRDGTLSGPEISAFKAVLEDLSTNPAYGRLYLAQVPVGATLTYFQGRMLRVESEWQVDLAIVDYLGLLKPDRKRNSSREEMNDTLKDAKVFAQAFDNGRGVPLLSPWQIRREAYNEAVRTGHYSLDSLSDTSEAEKSPDAIVAFLRDAVDAHTMHVQVLKMRDSEIPEPFSCSIDLRAAVFRDQHLGDGHSGFVT